MHMNLQSGLSAGLLALLCVGGWCALIGLIARLSGWHALAERYPSDERIEGELFRFASMSVGPKWFPSHYGGCLFVRLADDGVRLSILFPFRMGHPPLFIPWHAVEDCRQERFWFATYTTVQLVEPKMPMTFSGKLGRALLDAWSKRGRGPALAKQGDFW